MMDEPQTPSTTSSAAESRSTGFVATDEGAPPSLRVFGAAYVVLWTLLLAVLFVVRRRQRALRARVERLEDSLDL
jgi:hypothetical protein